MLGTYIHKFTLPKGPQVFVPSAPCRQTGAAVHKEVRRRWRVPHYFYHLRAGGHVAALKTHLHNHCFATLDISRFFDSVTRTKVHRALRDIGVGHDRAWEIAQESTVEKNQRRRDYSLPYGFVQSPVLASVALDRSALGRAMRTVARSNHTRLSCYVDDVILSGIEEDTVEGSRLAMIEAAHQSGFALNDLKSQRPSTEITAFNVALSNGSMAITAERLHEFEDDILALGALAVAAILTYVRSINRSQAEGLARIALTCSNEEVRAVAANYLPHNAP
jgi:Reverse transcriptase (RNA-dependent DNA polymerase)